MDAATMQYATLDSLQALSYVTFVAITSFTVVCWDMITFADEYFHVALIWCKHKGPPLFAEYIMPLGFFVNMVGELALILPNWSTELRCRNFVRYQGVMAIIGVSIELIMLMRVHALYRDRWLVAAVPDILLLVWVALEACLIALGKNRSDTTQF
ncbi:hypothetical protein BDR03DRAFT_984281 [Suillus americanus]|nr:hypothetical protein BDR03DRAFT_984281 [Suillus americanus]